MARVRTWWNRSFAPTVFQRYAAVDLLETTELARPGATMQRTLGRVDVRGVWTGQGSAINLRYGVVVTDFPLAEMVRNSSTVKFSAFATISLDQPGRMPGDWVTLDPADTRTTWDSEGMRTFLPGESVWLLIWAEGFRDDPPVQAIGYSRTLILNPEGVAG